MANLGPEYVLHRHIVAVLAYALPGVKWWHTPNEGKRSRVAGGILKSMGMTAGVSDFLFCIPPHGKTAALEIKAKGNKPTDLQKKFLDDIRSAGGLAGWTNDFDEACRLLKEWRIIR